MQLVRSFQCSVVVISRSGKLQAAQYGQHCVDDNTSCVGHGNPWTNYRKMSAMWTLYPYRCIFSANVWNRLWCDLFIAVNLSGSKVKGQGQTCSLSTNYRVKLHRTLTQFFKL